MFAVSLRTKIWIKTFLTVASFSFGPKLGTIFGVLCFCCDTDFIFFFSGTNFFLGFLTKQQNSWKWFSQHFVSSWDSCFKGKLIGRKNMYFNFRLCKNVFSDLIKRFFLRKNRRTNTVYFNFWFFSLKKRILCKQDIVLCWDFHVKLYVYIQPVIWV